MKLQVYSPHTAVDAAPEGLGDWLADIVTGTLSDPEPETHTATSADKPSAKSKGDEKRPALPPRPTAARSYSKPTYPGRIAIEDTDLTPSSSDHKRTAIHPSVSPPEGFSGAGMGRLVTFSSPQPLTNLIERIARGVGSPKGFPVAIPQNRAVEDIMIRTVGICAGSGGSVLKDVQADLLFTGELSHHEALAATERGACVVTLFHSNTERGFLRSVLKPKLEKELKSEWEKVRKEEAQGVDEMDGNREGAVMEGWEEAVSDDMIEVEVSERDRDPYGIVILQSDVEGTVLGGGKNGGNNGSKGK